MTRYAPSYFEWAEGRFLNRMTATEVAFRQQRRTADDAIDFTDETYQVQELTLADALKVFPQLFEEIQ